jgi:hypothetical protein
MPVVSSQTPLLRKLYQYTTIGMVSELVVTPETGDHQKQLLAVYLSGKGEYPNQKGDRHVWRHHPG